jgi:hypothetical protein
MIPGSTVVANTHDRERCNALGDVESFSEMGTPLIGEGAPSEPFADSTDDRFDTSESRRSKVQTHE